jgi:hypothetical protein
VSDDLLKFDNLTDIHNEFMAHWRGEPTIDETAYNIGMRCAFLTWYGPLTTDLFRAFVVPFRGQLWLTWQKWVNHDAGFEKLDVVNCMQVNPFDLVDNFRKCVEALQIIE